MNLYSHVHWEVRKELLWASLLIYAADEHEEDCKMQSQKHYILKFSVLQIWVIFFSVYEFLACGEHSACLFVPGDADPPPPPNQMALWMSVMKQLDVNICQPLHPAAAFRIMHSSRAHYCNSPSSCPYYQYDACRSRRPPGWPCG
jgi:hypothetical protein